VRWAIGRSVFTVTFSCCDVLVDAIVLPRTLRRLKVKRVTNSTESAGGVPRSGGQEYGGYKLRKMVRSQEREEQLR
jgi:hypothetical protein